MATFLMFGTYSPESTKAISAERTNAARDLIAQHHGEYKGGYALLGDVDLVLIVELPDTERAMKTSVALTDLLGISFRTAPAVTIEAFDELMS
jgi:uncharacterized protein with GYD domain